MEVVTISSKYQAVIPREVQQQFNRMDGHQDDHSFTHGSYNSCSGPITD